MVFRYGDRIAEALGIDPKARQLNVETLFLATEKHPGAYWLQLLVATGIAYMGLALDSTAVLIGAMLISPLMGPIVQVGMGFAIGHLHLTLRGGWRLVSSIGLVVALAAATSLLPPLARVTQEIIGRTQPTLLDLVVALFCGLAAAFTTARGSKDTVTAAAGTSIAIALVPPLCVVGFGIGTGDASIRNGASLLFVANLSAIILVGDLFFLLTGFARTDVERLEQRVYDEEDQAGWLYRAAKALPIPASLSRSLALRLLLPLTFVALVSVPLQRALSQVLWKVQVEATIEAKLASHLKGQPVLQKTFTVSPEAVAIGVVMVGNPDTRAELERELERVLADATEGRGRDVARSVQLHLVPNTEAVERRLADNSARFTKALDGLPAAPACPPPPPPVDVAAIETKARQEGAAEAVKALTVGAHLHRVHDAVARVLGWTNPPPPADGAWLSWALASGSGGITLYLTALTDSPVAELGVLANALRHETGLDLGVQVIRVARTVWDQAEPPTAEALAAALAPGKAHGLRFQATAPAPDAAKGRARAAIEAGRAALEAAGLAVQPGERWVVRAVPPATSPFPEAK